MNAFDAGMTLQIHAAFHHWYAKCHEDSADEMQMIKACSILMNRALAAAFAGWKEAAQASRDQMGDQRRAMARFVMGEAARKLATWREVAAEERATRDLMRRAGSHFPSRGMAVGS